MAQDGVTFAGAVSINAVELIAGGSKIDIREQISFITRSDKSRTK